MRQLPALAPGPDEAQWWPLSRAGLAWAAVAPAPSPACAHFPGSTDSCNPKGEGGQAEQQVPSDSAAPQCRIWLTAERRQANAWREASWWVQARCLRSAPGRARQARQRRREGSSSAVLRAQLPSPTAPLLGPLLQRFLALPAASLGAGRFGLRAQLANRASTPPAGRQTDINTL